MQKSSIVFISTELNTYSDDFEHQAMHFNFHQSKINEYLNDNQMHQSKLTYPMFHWRFITRL
jgi:hypothetical protein